MKMLTRTAACFFIASIAHADLTTCTDLYVGKIVSKQGIGLERFTVTDAPTNGAGSNWIYLTGWSKEDANSVLSILLSAKMAQQSISIDTLAASGCDIDSAQTLNKLTLPAG